MCRPIVSLLIPLALLATALTACSPLAKDATLSAADLVSVEALPAGYGELVSVTFAPQGDGGTGWREMWFENEATGTVTYVPVRLPDWKYDPEMVRTFGRPGWKTPAEVTP